LPILYERFWDYQGEDKRDNPFRNLRFKNVTYKDIPAFERSWIEDNILAAGALDNLNFEARCIIYALIETGCRPSEIANLKPEHIVLDHAVPHLKIRPQTNRQLKSKSARRAASTIRLSGALGAKRETFSLIVPSNSSTPKA
jgi:integrase